MADNEAAFDEMMAEAAPPAYSAEPDVVPFEVPYNPGSGAEDVSPEKDGGVFKEILTAGTGDELPGLGDSMVVHYTGRLREDGSKFDSSKDAHRGPPFRFNLGKGEVIKAWDIGVATMKKGEVARFTCKSDLCYGKRGSPPNIPPDADLIFDVELLEWNGEDISKASDGGIIRTLITSTKSFSTPNEGASVKIHAIGKHEGRVFLEKDFDFRLDFDDVPELPRGVTEGLYKFHKGEKAVLKLSPEYGFGAEGHKELGIPAHAALAFVVELKDFTKVKDRWEMEASEKRVQADVYKKLGTELFQKGEFKKAEAKYKKAVEFLDDGGIETDEDKKSRNELLLAVRLNLALVSAKLNEHKDAAEECTKALDIDPNSEKALFRRGQALLAMHEPEQAIKDFQKVLELNPANKAASAQIGVCKKVVTEIKQRDKMIYRKIFEKYSADGDKKTDSSSLPMPDTWANEAKTEGAEPKA